MNLLVLPGDDAASPIRMRNIATLYTLGGRSLPPPPEEPLSTRAFCLRLRRLCPSSTLLCREAAGRRCASFARSSHGGRLFGIIADVVGCRLNYLCGVQHSRRHRDHLSGREVPPLRTHLRRSSEYRFCCGLWFTKTGESRQASGASSAASPDKPLKVVNWQVSAFTRCPGPRGGLSGFCPESSARVRQQSARSVRRRA